MCLRNTMDRLWTKGDRIEVLGIGQSRMSRLHSEVTLGQFLAESWIGVEKSAYTTFFSLAETSTVLQLTVRDLHSWPVKFFHASCYRLSCIAKENSTFKSRLESVSPAIKLHRFARPQRNTRSKAPPSPSRAPTQRLPIAAMARLSRQKRHKPRVTDF
jgi:hypothetical protein